MTTTLRVKNHAGLTLLGMLFTSIVVVLLLLLGFKLVPVYVEYYAIQKTFKALAADPSLRGAPRRQVAGAFASRAAVEDIKAIGPESVQVTKGGDGIIVSAEYEKKVPLFHNISACFDFKPSSE